MPALGIEPASIITNAWTDPITTFELHNSHIETLVGLCAKRFEFEYIERRQPPISRVFTVASDIRMGMGSAAHKVIEEVITQPNKKYGELTDEAWQKYLEPHIIDPDAADKYYKEFQRNIWIASDYLGDALDFSKAQIEKAFVIPDVVNLSDRYKGIDPRWKFAGKMDISEWDEENATVKIIDLKFREKPQYERNKASTQPSMYSLAALAHGYTPEFIFVEIVKGKVVEQRVEVTPEKLEWFHIKARQAIDLIENNFFPISPSGWHCSQKYCKFWSICRGQYEPAEEPTSEGEQV